ncbi:MAG: M23 family metallopeptidase [Bacteroidia bacterium]|jgi:murein DD-endopeptidase MepM/ murein hydrolase activator NlpD|nr:M23 family metallopeptidase [Bacteroidia bacterium]MDG2042760.1 M23 family metallopeptidase [Bacteroidia bacterium]|tara:strand:- start:702 stop:1664 length:963 start_codon:yes stop_codon:yes gene_type:complete
MRKTKFRFNPETLEYEKVSNTLLIQIARVFGFISLAVVIGIISFLIVYNGESTEALKNQLADYEIQVKLLEKKSLDMQTKLDDLSSMDDHVYREIFGADPISNDIRKAGTGGSDKYISLDQLRDGEKIKKLHQRLDNMENQSKIQQKSYEKLIVMAKNKSKMLASIPAIQPVSNKNLRRIASGFGYRIDPIYRTRKMHKGLDFSAPTGTKIYATGDGVIKKVKRARWGYGTHVVIDHGYGYTTLYGHMSRASVKQGQRVKRGQQIGLVGSTGKSTGPHLHYEVAKNGVQVNPIGYFYNDLTTEQYEEIIKLSSNPNQSFD